jgi:PAS domain S-box-containing protein
VQDQNKQTAEQLLQSLPAAVYATDAAGRITFYNEAAVRLWGVRPRLGSDEFCGSWKLYRTDGTDLPHSECPMAIALREQRPIHGAEAIAERPDGTRVPFIAHPTPLFDHSGKLTGAVNMLVDASNRQISETAMYRLAAIIDSSDDAIVAKDLNGIITDWNQAAERLFGYTADETIGKSVTILIPDERHDEEPEILSRIRRGERIDHYETVRQRKDGSLVEISLSVSPIIDMHGRIIGASKIARDITDRKRQEEQRNILFREMNHRIKNLFSISSALVTLSARYATSTADLVTDLRERFGALARAHALTLQSPTLEEAAYPDTTLHSLIRTIASPYRDQATQARIVISGPDVPLAEQHMAAFALLLHEFATNAAKYGALSTPDGTIDISCVEDGDQFTMIWREFGSHPDAHEADEGFGSFLIRTTVTGALRGTFERTSDDQGLIIKIMVPRDHLAAAPASPKSGSATKSPSHRIIAAE